MMEIKGEEEKKEKRTRREKVGRGREGRKERLVTGGEVRREGQGTEEREK